MIGAVLRAGSNSLILTVVADDAFLRAEGAIDLRRGWLATVGAEFVSASGFELLINGDPVIENKAFALETLIRELL